MLENSILYVATWDKLMFGDGLAALSQFRSILYFQTSVYCCNGSWMYLIIFLHACRDLSLFPHFLSQPCCNLCLMENHLHHTALWLFHSWLLAFQYTRNTHTGSRRRNHNCSDLRSYGQIYILFKFFLTFCGREFLKFVWRCTSDYYY